MRRIDARLMNLEAKVRSKVGQGCALTNWPPQPETVEEWSNLVAWAEGETDGAELRPELKQAWREWEEGACHGN